eukprot:TRINITY_DN2141_c0_g2_i2.p1 TRINITY_DN2141_c0_g2~~TRINITY_DN2141_c0_g2_i2.p1  ORF type:complete len:255 (-),score=73.08 TRINITY_DN2141_c0_g2_i2:71-835(-)
MAKPAVEYDYEGMLTNELPQFIDTINNANWAKCTKKHGTRVHRADIGGWTAFRTKSRLNFDVDAVFHAAYDADQHLQFDSAMTEYERLCTLHEEDTWRVDLVRTVSAPALRGIIVARELIDVRLMVVLEDGYAILQHSIACDYGAKNKLLRAWSYPSGSIIQKASHSTPEHPVTKLTELVSVDLKGNIPMWACNKTIPAFRVVAHDAMKKFLASGVVAPREDIVADAHEDDEEEEEEEEEEDEEECDTDADDND